jgi:Dolichyl-phosphate-mannose-protein mannosyltransferase
MGVPEYALHRPLSRAVTRRALAIFVGLAVCGSLVALLVRLLVDVWAKPYFMDEGIAGMISAPPLSEVLRTAVWERGGAPAHFVAVHLAFLVDASPSSLRLVSVIFAVLTVGVTFDLGRRLAGPVAGAIAAALASTSALLVIYGTYGRMYSMFAFAGGLACDLFVRAIRKRTVGAAVAAALAASFVSLVHPFGGILFAIEAGAALWLWRGRALRSALPVVALAALTLLVVGIGDLRLGGRFSAAIATQSTLLTPRTAAIDVLQALLGFSGGITLAALLLIPLGIVGASAAIRREPAIAAVTIVPFLVLPAAQTVISVQGGSHAAARHLIFMLPAWSAFVALAATRLTSAFRPSAALVFAAVVIAAGASGGATSGLEGALDPRADALWQEAGTSKALRAPAEWIRSRVNARDVLFPYSPVYVQALPQTSAAHALPRDPPGAILAAVGHAQLPVRRLFVALPILQESLDLRVLENRLGTRFEVARVGRWLMIEAQGPFNSRERILETVLRSAREAEQALGGGAAGVQFYLSVATANVCHALQSLSPRPPRAETCPPLVA